MSAAEQMETPWTDYASEKPSREGLFEWRIPALGKMGMKP